MLNGSHFYYQTIRRSVVAFGNLFKDIVLVVYDKTTRAEINRRTVPLVYGGKEDFQLRLGSIPDLPAAVDLNLPTISFSLKGFEYDSKRKLQSQLQSFNKTSSGGVNHQYQGVPYNLKFEVSYIVRNIEDGLQITEQILPWFNPDYTLTMNFVDSMNIVRNIPIVLDEVMWENDYEGTAKDKLRSITWTLNFTMQTYLFGPVYNGGIIKTATANVKSMVAVGEDLTYLSLTLANTGFLSFKQGEYVYQGHSLPQSNAVGTVVNFTGQTLTLSNVQGKFVANSNVHGALTAASWNVAAVPAETLLAEVQVAVNPPTANITDDFGFTTTITETPNIT